jgi:putative ABC transport system permease protein
MSLFLVLRHSLRVLRRGRATVAAATAILAIGLGAATLMFAVLSTVLIRPLPFGAPDRLVAIWAFVPQLGSDAYPVGGRQFTAIRDGASGLAGVDAFKAEALNLRTADGHVERLDGLVTTAGLFDTLRVQPVAGRFFRQGEDRPGAGRVVVIGDGVWSRLFGRSPSIIGSGVSLNDESYTVVGVAPRGFEFPRGGEMPGNFQFPSRTELWIPGEPPQSGPQEHAMVARLRDGVSAPQAQAALDAVTRTLEAQLPAAKGWFGTRLVPLDLQTVPQRTRTLVRLLFAAAVVLVLVACGNAAQLLVVRGLSRRREIAVRAALGAPPGALAAEAVVESILISTCAAALASAFAAGGLRVLRAIGPARFPRLAELSFDWRIAAFAVVCALAVALITALWPIVATRSASAQSLIRGNMRGTTGGSRRIRAALLAAQVAASVVLLITTGLLARSLLNREAVDPGFDSRGVLTFEVTLPPSEYPEQSRGPLPAVRPKIVAAIDRILARVRSDPRVAAAALGKPLPLSGAQETTGYSAEGVPPPAPGTIHPMTEYIVGSDELFDALGARLLYGRGFTAADREASMPVAVVTRALARLEWHQDNVVGRRVKLGGLASPGPWMTIVGVVADITRYDLGEQALPTMFVPYTQGPYSALNTVSFVVRGRTSDPLALVGPAREAARAADPALPIAAVAPLSDFVARASEDVRFSVVLMSAIAIAAMLLALAGLSGTVALGVTTRTPEIGVRLALGADRRRILGLVIRDGLYPALGGIIAGAAAAAATMAVTASLLFGVTPHDTLTFVVVPLIVLAVASLACGVPAIAATRIDPREALSSLGMTS